MSVKFATVRGQIPSTTGTLDLTVSGLGTPKALILFGTRGAGTEVNIVNRAAFIGITDGTTQLFIAAASRHSVPAGSGTTRKAYKGKLFEMWNASTGALLTTGAFNSWITDGVRLDITQHGGGVQNYITACLFAGDLVDPHADDFTISSATLDITAPGHLPDLVFCISSNDAFAAATNPNTDSLFSIGCAARGGDQMCATHLYPNAVNPTSQSMYVDTAKVYRRITAAGAAEAVSLSDFDDDGFTANLSDDTGETVEIGYLSLSFGGGVSGYAVDLLVTPTATGTQDEIVGFQPQGVIFVSTRGSTVDSWLNNVLAGSHGFGAMDGTRESSYSTWDQHNASTPNTGQRVSNEALEITTHNGTASISAVFSSWLSNGYRLNHTLADTANPRRSIAISIGAALIMGSGGGVIDAPTGSGTGVIPIQGSGAGVVPPSTGAGTGDARVEGTGAGVIDAPTGAGTGQVAAEAQGAGAVASPTGSGAGQLVIEGSAAGAIAAPTGAGTGEALVTGSGAGVAPAPIGAGVGQLEALGVGAGVAGAPVGAGTGIVEQPAEGQGAGIVAPSTGAGSGQLIATGSGAGAVAAPAGAGVGEALIVGVGAGVVAAPAGAGIGETLVVGVGAGVVDAPVGAGAGIVEQMASGVGAGIVGAPIGSGQGQVGMLMDERAVVHDLVGRYEPVSELVGDYEPELALVGVYDPVWNLEGGT